MLDLVLLAMIALVPLLGLSIRFAKQRKYSLHKRIQLTLGVILLVAVAAFEIEMRVFGWKERAAESPYWHGESWRDPVHYSLIAHLFFAVPTAILWILVTVRAMRNFPRPPEPGSHSPFHRFWAPLAAFEMLMTAVTGWVFYWLAFVAK